MINSGFTVLLIIIVNAVVSYNGFNNQSFFDGYKFDAGKILRQKDYKRLITSGFLHVDWQHLIFNMLSLYFFSGFLEGTVGTANFLLIYFASLLGGSLLTLFIHRHHDDYTAVGASGAVSGVIFASIVLFPGMGIGFFMLPFSIPGWLYGLVYILYSMYGIKSKRDNIGHEAHLGGALLGMAAGIFIQPSAVAENYLTIIIIAVPLMAFLYLVVTKPAFLLADNFFFHKKADAYSIDHKYNLQKAKEQKEIDYILEKISRGGMASLSKKEKEKLQQFSKK